MEDAVSQEELLASYIRKNKKELAVGLLFKLIVKHAQTKNFAKADALREKLFKVDSMALNEIVKSADIIEAAKVAAIDPVHRQVWSHLYHQLTNEETISLYYGMQKASYEAEQIIYRQGEMNSNLYFINAGKIKMFYHKDKDNILLKTLAPGDIAGEDTFFSHSTCTTSLMAHSAVQLNFLERAVFTKWRAEDPHLANQLQDYCLQLEPIEALLQKKELERRVHRRYALSASAAIRILDRPGKKVFKGDISDISVSGISFIMNTSQELAESFLGCCVNLKFSLPEGLPERRIDQNGSIVGVHSRLFNEYLVNVKWDEPLDGRIIERISFKGKRHEIY